MVYLEAVVLCNSYEMRIFPKVLLNHSMFKQKTTYQSVRSLSSDLLLTSVIVTLAEEIFKKLGPHPITAHFRLLALCVRRLTYYTSRPK